jgi:hypothetical protein
MGRLHHDSSVYDLALANMNETTETSFEIGSVYVFDTDVEAVACGWLKHSFQSLIICCYMVVSSSINTESLK